MTPEDAARFILSDCQDPELRAQRAFADEIDARLSAQVLAEMRDAD